MSGFTLAAERQLRERDWPGNVRELRNAIERAVLLADGPAIDVGDLEPPPTPRGTVDAVLPFPAPLDEIVHAAAVRTLERCGGNKSETARRLGISRPRLLRILGEDEAVIGAVGDDVDGPDVRWEREPRGGVHG
jgi:two-component system response regulator HydG